MRGKINKIDKDELVKEFYRRATTEVPEKQTSFIILSRRVNKLGIPIAVLERIIPEDPETGLTEDKIFELKEDFNLSDDEDAKLIELDNSNHAPIENLKTSKGDLIIQLEYIPNGPTAKLIISALQGHLYLDKLAAYQLAYQDEETWVDSGITLYDKNGEYMDDPNSKEYKRMDKILLSHLDNRDVDTAIEAAKSYKD